MYCAAPLGSRLQARTSLCHLHPTALYPSPVTKTAHEDFPEESVQRWHLERKRMCALPWAHITRPRWRFSPDRCRFRRACCTLPCIIPIIHFLCPIDTANILTLLMQLPLPAFLQRPLGRLPRLDFIGSISRYQCWHEPGRDGRSRQLSGKERQLTLIMFALQDMISP